MRRREFLQNALAGGALITMPALLDGCAVSERALVTAPLPEDPFLDWFAVDRAAISRLLGALGANGAQAADLYFQFRRQSTLRFEHSELASARTDVLQGVGLRVLRDGASGFAYTEDLTEAGMSAAARRAAGRSDGTPTSAPIELVAVPPGTLYTSRLAWSDVGIEQKLPILEKVDALARAGDPSVTDVGVSWSDTDERVLIAVLDGRLIVDRRPLTRLSVQITMTRKGIAHSGFANLSARAELPWYDDERIALMVAEAVERTQILFEARRPPVGTMPVVLAGGTSGVLLHEVVGHAIEADFVRDGTSPYARSLDERIAAGSVTIVDQATLENERGALNVDDEGVQCRRNVLVENGILRSYLHDQTTAIQFGTASTGSGRRESYRHEPMPRMTCTFMEAGDHAREELIATMGRGLVAETFTGGAVKLGGGDFRFDVKHGWLVEKGRILMPVRDFTLAGNGADMLRNVSMVASDFRLDMGGWTCGKKGQSVPVSHGMPSVLVSALDVGA